MMRRLLPLAAVALLALQLAGCGAGSQGDSDDALPSNAEASQSATPDPSEVVTIPSPSASSQPSATAQASADESSLQDAAREVMGALRDRDLKRLAGWIDEDRGVRFSPYAHMNESDLVFKADSLPTFKDTDERNWGSYDGSGEPIDLSFRDYFEKFVYDQDFADAPDVTEGKLLGTGNTPFNGQEIYPGSSFVEFHFPGFDDKLEGHDWESLILTFAPSGNDWRLCAVTHAQWTI